MIIHISYGDSQTRTYMYDPSTDHKEEVKPSPSLLEKLNTGNIINVEGVQWRGFIRAGDNEVIIRYYFNTFLNEKIVLSMILDGRDIAGITLDKLEKCYRVACRLFYLTSIGHTIRVIIDRDMLSRKYLAQLVRILYRLQKIYESIFVDSALPGLLVFLFEKKKSLYNKICVGQSRCSSIVDIARRHTIIYEKPQPAFSTPITSPSMGSIYM